MSNSPDCPRCRNHFVVPDAPTESEFLKQARQIWRAERPQPKKTIKHRGHPLMPNSDLAQLATGLVREEARKVTAKTKELPAAVIDRWASSPATYKEMTKKLAATANSAEESTIRRHVKLALIDQKSITAVTDEDKKFLEKRQRTTARLLKELPEAGQRRIMKAIRTCSDTINDTVRRDFPKESRAAEKRGRPLTFAQIKQLYASRQKG